MRLTSHSPALDLFVLAFVLMQTTWAFPDFQTKIPNGKRVPHPCLDNYLWAGLGHKDSYGGGERNAFGLDFDLNGRKWDSCLCEQDSDGDGRTNGEELGDPDCVWTEGDIPAVVDGLTHPGVCEPLNSPVCQERNNWEFCTLENFVCDAIQDSDVIEHKMEFPTTMIPDDETTYFCMQFELPSDQEYHMIAHKPILNNTLLAHHMVAYACGAPTDDFQSPESCGMVKSCWTVLALWTLGRPGECYPDHYGFRIGQNGFKYVILEVHWNNPERLNNQVDAPGMYMYLTPHLRVNDAGTLMMGTTNIEIPGRSPAHVIHGTCHPECTNVLPHDINIDYVYLHMHYLGQEASFLHTTGDQTTEVIKEEHYSYDNPSISKLTDVTVSRGDTISIRCTYNSLHKHAATLFGEGTSDEMCFAFVTYYPAVHEWDICDDFGTVIMCPNPNMTYGVPEGCDYNGFRTSENLVVVYQQIMSQIGPVCDVPGASPENCPQGCAEAVADVRANEPCLRDDMGKLMEMVYFGVGFGDLGDEIIRLLHVCDPDWDRTISDPEYGLEDLSNVTTNSPTQPPDPAQCVFDVSGASDNEHFSLIMTYLAVTFILIKM